MSARKQKARTMAKIKHIARVEVGDLHSYSPAKRRLHWAR